LLKGLGVDVRPLTVGDMVVRSPIDGMEIAAQTGQQGRSREKDRARRDRGMIACGTSGGRLARRPLLLV